MKYKSIDTSTLSGLKAAERLQSNGWRIYRTGLFRVWLCRPN